MLTLKDKLSNGQDFLLGVELVTTRGTMREIKAVQTRRLASDLVDCDRVDWVSITDNAGGNPMLSPMALGKTVLYAGKEVLIHLSCKDLNRNGLESEAWQLASEGFQNILSLSGDYPASGYHGRAKPVFDIDSVGLLTLLGEMNRGLDRPPLAANGIALPLRKTSFFMGAVATNFKYYENEVVPQYLKMEKKIKVGANFIITQIGYDSRKSHEMKVYLDRHGYGQIPLIGNVFLLSLPVAQFFRSQKIPGVVISDELLAECQRQARGADRGRAYFRELAAQQISIFRGLGFRGAYLGGVHRMDDIEALLEIENSFAPNDWREFARRINYGRSGEFYLHARHPETGMADPQQLNPDYEASQKTPPRTRNVTWSYRLNKLVHETVFAPGARFFQWGRRLYTGAADSHQGPTLLRLLEHASKSAMFRCKDCGDCSLPDIAYLCPESQCAKNQRNGPCGGTRNGKCEVDDYQCIWARAYDRLKFEGRATQLLDHAPVIQNELLRGTSSWANTFLGRDHHSISHPSPHCKAHQDDAVRVPREHEGAERQSDTSASI